MNNRDLKQRIAEIAADCGGTVCVAVRNIRNALDLSINDDIVVSSASIIKVPIIVEAMRQVAAGKLSLDTLYELRDEHRVRGSGVMRYLHTGTLLNLKDLLTLMIIVSDNTATNMIIDLLDVQNVNSTMRALGLTKTRLQRKMYDWEAIERGLDNICTAGEIADLLVMIARNEAAGGEWDQMILDILHQQQDTTRLGMFLPEEVRLANKTGSHRNVFHDCGIVSTDDFSYAVSVFTKCAYSPGDAQVGIARVSRAIYDAIINL